ncbi:MAG: cytochrome C [Bdellovibrio sp. ArHS]|uniref:c-type cytochrome n=1 Tax=Bdellovibrio sp. ArHS TaxID=1569284 RepID=UPI000583721C|nr:c-type cytochrome [Bdellovibrio sp. ArHS]KHD89600.1 MAG: cytochrome C [Bdellovibrio sp. ArHS]
MQKIVLAFLVINMFSVVSCTKKEEVSSPDVFSAAAAPTTGGGDIGVGPITSLVLESEIKADLVKHGTEVFSAKCAACHKMGERYVGPDLKGVTERRKPEWIMNMILNPQEMTQKDPIAQELLGEYMTQMTFQNVTQDETRAILEYFRSIDKK